MSFVRLENLNDFIQPSTSCIKPVEKKQVGVVAKVNDISLSDCLACSGCITSAETVLVQQQNYAELFKIINDNKVSKVKRDIVVSLSLQSVASLAHKYSIGAQETAERLASFFVSLGCSKIYDINLARHLALVESLKEYNDSKNSNSQTKLKLPIISSICPGWVCYVEKTNGELVIPHLSKVRSPQQIMGSLIKANTCNHDGSLVNRNDIYHVTLMPCFDKKLEASRQDFTDSEDGSKDVDCVLTPIELDEILNSEEVTLMDFDRRKLDILVETNEAFDSPLTSNFGSSSGGYAENILLAEACKIPGSAICDSDNMRSRLKYSTFKNSDFIEITLDTSSKENLSSLPRVAIVNGFRNIQTVVQRLKRKALKYDYIEIMACPSGCINGGAQCKIEKVNSGEESLKLVEEIYKQVPETKLSLRSAEEFNVKLYRQLKLNDDQKALHTQFRPVPKMQNLMVNW